MKTTIYFLLCLAMSGGCIGQNTGGLIQISNHIGLNEPFFLFGYGDPKLIDSIWLENGQSAAIPVHGTYPLYAVALRNVSAGKFYFFKDRDQSVQIRVDDSGMSVSGSRLDSLWRQSVGRQDSLVQRARAAMGPDAQKAEYIANKVAYENWAFTRFRYLLTADTFVALRFLNFHIAKLQQLTEINSEITDSLAAIVQNGNMAEHPLVAKTNALGNLKNLSCLKTGATRFDFNFKTSEGDTLNTRHFAGEMLLIDFGASWCKPCRQKALELKTLHEQIKARGITIIGISLNENEVAWMQYLEQVQLPWQQGILMKSNKRIVQDRYNAHAIPLMVLFSKEGKVLSINPGISELLGR